jgi:hypothetical protein
LRNTNPALAIGSLELASDVYPKSILAYFRKTQNEEIFVLHNLGKEEVMIDVPKGFSNKIYQLGSAVYAEGKVKLGKNSSVILSK